MRSKDNPSIFVVVEDHHKATLHEQLIEQYHPNCHLHFFGHWIDLLAALGKTPDQNLPTLVILSVATKRAGAYNVLSWLSQHKRLQHIPAWLLGDTVSDTSIRQLLSETSMKRVTLG